MTSAVAFNPHHTWTTPVTDIAPDRFSVIHDDDWTALAAALDTVRPKVGRPFRDERRTLEAVVWRFQNDARWREIPDALGPWWRAAQLYYRWDKTGLWPRLRQALAERGREDLAALFAGEGAAE